MWQYSILSIFSVLVSLGLLVVILGQYHEMQLIRQKNNDLKLLKESHDDKLNKELSLKKSLEEIVAPMQTKLTEVEAKVGSSSSEVEKKKTNADTCETEMKTKIEEMDSVDQKHKNTIETVNAESEAWKQEITMLNAHLKERSPICDYVTGMALCGNTTS